MEERMKAKFEGATIKVWFNTLSTSRNFYNVAEIVQEGNAVLIRTGNGDQHLLNFENVNMIEELETEDMDKKLLELQEKYGRNK
jgi:hypothetical protein